DKDNIWAFFASHSYTGNEREILAIDSNDIRRVLVRDPRKSEEEEVWEKEEDENISKELKPIIIDNAIKLMTLFLNLFFSSRLQFLNLFLYLL
ncbi:MAG: hypothetical protein AABW52_00320, partial [Nanoarchaeota archaeon]